MEDFVQYESRSSLALVLVMAGAIFLSGLWMVGIFGTVPYSPKLSHRDVVVIGWCLVLFSGVCGFQLFKSFLNPIEQLRIGPHGVRSANWSEDTIPWSEITRVTIWRGNRQRAIMLHLRNPDRFPGGRRAATIAAANRPLSGGDIPLCLGGTDRSIADAISAIQRFKSVG